MEIRHVLFTNIVLTSNSESGKIIPGLLNSIMSNYKETSEALTN